MRARLKFGVRLRADSFGGICYVAHRDDFYAANATVFALLKSIPQAEWMHVTPDMAAGVEALAKLGICETTSPQIVEEPYSGPGFLGEFLEIPTVAEPLVLNVFSTAHCPLKCVYCHADDLMQSFRDAETSADLENIAATALSVPSIVAVITGGDPLTRPDRAKYLIERLSGHKALVLDTSGAGDIDRLIPDLVQHHVHVRVSLDAISDTNDRLRPNNPKYVKNRNASRSGAEYTIRRCLESGVPVTVQTVISSRNENISEWMMLREWLVDRGVRNWVMHIAIKGGNARRLDDAARKQDRTRSILPSLAVVSMLGRFIRDTQVHDYAIDIRCTDTNGTPNSVLLVSNTGDLYTEGYAHNGKVLLYQAQLARPDLLKKLWAHIDHFGHACRYFNWNRRLYDTQSIRELYYAVPCNEIIKPRGEGTPVETEVKYWVTDVASLRNILLEANFSFINPVWQRDEYYDTPEIALKSLDFVVRLRSEDQRSWVSLKGPRFYSRSGSYSRIELEFEARSEETIRRDLATRGLSIKWFFEKRREEYHNSISGIKVMIDEVPEIGFFIEIEGPETDVAETTNLIITVVGRQETRNYRDIFVEYKRTNGADISTLQGATFATT